jgi:hypothetical protein
MLIIPKVIAPVQIDRGMVLPSARRAGWSRSLPAADERQSAECTGASKCTGEMPAGDS